MGWKAWCQSELSKCNSAQRDTGKDKGKAEKQCRHSHEVFRDLTECSLFASRHFGVTLAHEASVMLVLSEG